MQVHLPCVSNDSVRIPNLAALVPEPVAVAPRVFGTVLLVDDDDAVRRLAERALSRRGWRVIAAASGAAALARLDAAAAPIAALVTDMAMPGMDGARVIEAVRGRLSAPALPVVVASGYSAHTCAGSVIEAGVYYLAKPYAPKELVAMVERAITAALDPAIGRA